LYIHYSRLNELYQSLKYELSEKKSDRTKVAAASLNYKSATVNHALPYVGEMGNHL